MLIWTGPLLSNSECVPIFCAFYFNLSTVDHFDVCKCTVKPKNEWIYGTLMNSVPVPYKKIKLKSETNLWKSVNLKNATHLNIKVIYYSTVYVYTHYHLNFKKWNYKAVRKRITGYPTKKECKVCMVVARYRTHKLLENKDFVFTSTSCCYLIYVNITYPGIYCISRAVHATQIIFSQKPDKTLSFLGISCPHAYELKKPPVIRNQTAQIIANFNTGKCFPHSGPPCKETKTWS